MVRVPYANLLLGVFHRGSSCGFDNQGSKKGIFSRRFLFLEGGGIGILKKIFQKIFRRPLKKNRGRGRPPIQGGRPGAGGAQEQLLRRPHASTSWWTIHTSKSPKVAPAPAHPGAPWGTSPEVHPGEPKSAYRTFGCAYGTRTVRVPYANLLLGVFHRGSSCGFDNQSFKKGIFSRRFLFFEGGGGEY